MEEYKDISKQGDKEASTTGIPQEFIEGLQTQIRESKLAMESMVGYMQSFSVALPEIYKMAQQLVTNGGNAETILKTLQETTIGLQRNLDVAVIASEGITKKLDDQIGKISDLEIKLTDTAGAVMTAHDEILNVKSNTDPEISRKEAWRMLWHSIGWGTIASTVCGTAAGFGLSRLATPAEHCTNTHTETHIVEKVPELPTKFTLRNRHGKIIYRLTAAPAPTK